MIKQKRVPNKATKTSLLEIDIATASKLECDLIAEFAKKRMAEVSAVPSSPDNLQLYLLCAKKLREVKARRLEIVVKKR